MIRYKMQFFGRVQGVGFRYHAYYKARSLGLTGWVENRYDGSVLMEVQGEQRAIDELVIHLKNQRFIDIEDMTVKQIPVIEERDFTEN